ncbi:MAG: hypothetical protein U0Y68_11985 [Blastocatellia bacterium]
MNENYLWDKSGEPDEEIQQLESLLSEFRYQPRPLVLPVEAPKPGFWAWLTPFFTVRYAVLAAMTLLALSAGLWLVTRPTELPEIAGQPFVTPSIAPAIIGPVAIATPPVALAGTPVPVIRQAVTPKPAVRLIKHHPPRANQRLEAEGELAKEKVLFALQLTSKQLNLISKKIQTDTN